MNSQSPESQSIPVPGFAAIAPFFLSSFIWNVVLGMTFIMIPLYARALGLSGVQIGTLISLPIVLHMGFSLVGGAFTDRLGGKNLAAISCGLTSLASIAFMASGSFASMLAAQLLMVVARSTFWTSSMSLASQLPGNPGKQMGRFTAATNGGQIVGSMLAGFLIGIFSYRFGFGVMAAASLAALALNQMYRSAAVVKSAVSISSAFRRYRELLAKRTMLFSMFCAYISALPVSLLISFYPILLIQQGLESGVAGSLLSVRGIGAVAAGFVAGQFVRDVRHLKTPLLSSIVVGLSVLLTVILSHPALIALFMFSLGVGSAVITIYGHVVIREVSSVEVRGSAMALFNVGFGISLLTTPFTIGVLKDLIGIENAFYLVGGFTVLCGLALVPVQRWAFATDPGKQSGIHQVNAD